MHTRKWFLFLLSILLPLALLAGCGRMVFSQEAVKAIHEMQGDRIRIEFRTDGDLNRLLRQAVQNSGEQDAIRSTLLDMLCYQDDVYFTSGGIRTADKGQHAVSVYRMPGTVSASDAAKSFAVTLYDVIRSLPSGGEYSAVLSMIKEGDNYYLAVDVTVVKQGGSGSDTDSGPAHYGPIDLAGGSTITGWGDKGNVSADAAMGNTLSNALNNGETNLINAMGWDNHTSYRDGIDQVEKDQHIVYVDALMSTEESAAKEEAKGVVEDILSSLPDGGEYEARVAMATNAQQYFLAVDVSVVGAPGEEIENSNNITVFVHYSSAGNVDDQFTKVKEGVSGTDGLDSKFSIPIKEALQENKPIKDNSEGAINFGAGKLGNDLAKLVLQYGTALFGQSEETLSSLLNEQHQTDYKNAKCVLLENLEETVKLLPATENYVKAYVVCTYQSAMENDAAATENLKNALVQKVKDNIKLQGEEKNFTLNNRKYRIYYNWGAANECDMIKIKTENGYLYAAALRLVFSYTEL